VPNENLYVEGEKLERVESYHYLGASVNCSVECCSEIKKSIEKVRAFFMRIKKMLCSRDLSLESDAQMWCGRLDPERIL